MKPDMLSLGATQAADIAEATVMDVTPEPFAVPVVDTPVAGDDIDILVEEMMAGAPYPLPMRPEEAGDEGAGLETFPGEFPEMELSDIVPTVAADANDASDHESGDTPDFLSHFLSIF